MQNSSLAESMRELRLKAGLSQGELAGKLGITQVTISNWENGRGAPKPAQITALQQILGLGAKNEDVTDASPLAAWLTKARISKEFSIPELAAKTGITPPAIYRIENGITRNLQKRTLQKLEKVLGDFPEDMAKEAEKEAAIQGLGSLEDFDPHSGNERPQGPGIYVFYDISERPIYVGEGANVKKRISDHEEKFWFKQPIVQTASWIRVEDQPLRKQIEAILIKFLKSNAVINKQHVERRDQSE